jgi:hypothetical protein
VPYINKTQLRQLKEIRRHLAMETCSFDGVHNEHVIPGYKGTGGFRAIGEPIATTDYVREKTRNWRDCWVTGPLDQLIADLEAKS